MAKKQITNQPKLFELPPADHEYSGGIISWQDIENRPSADLTMSEAGPVVNIKSRAHNLSKTLELLGKASQRHGFGAAVDIQPHSSEIWGRYRSGTPQVVERALENAESMKDDAKRYFWQATGLPAMIGSGVIGEREAKARARQMWENFYHNHAGPPNRKARDQRKKLHTKQLKH